MNVTKSPRWGVAVVGVGAALIGCFWLAAWWAGFAARWSAAGTMVTVKTNTALGLLLAGMALLLLGAGKTTSLRRWVGSALALLVLLLGSLTLSEHLLHTDLGIDQLLASEPPGAVATLSPNRMGPPGSTSHTLLGLALLTMALGWRRPAPYLGLAVCLINLVPAVGYLYGVHAFYTARPAGIAWPTVVAMLLLGTGLVLARPDAGPMAVLLRRDAGGTLLRRLLPFVVLLPLGLGFLRLLGQHHGLYDTATGTGLLVLSLILIFSIMLVRNAVALSSADRQQKQAAEALQASEGKYRELVDNANSIIIRMDREGRISFFNDYAQEFFGYSLDEALGQNVKMLVPPVESGSGRGLVEMADAILRNPDDFATSVNENVRKNGERVWVSWRNKAIEGRGGEIVGNLAIGQDITERKRAEEMLSRSQKTFFELVERSPFGTYIVDSQFRIAQMNAGSQAGAFQNVRPVIGRDFAEAMRILWPEDVAAGIIGAFRHTLDTGEPYYSPRFMHSRHDVETVEAYEWELHRMTLPDGQFGVICYYYDSTELRTAEAALRESEERYRSLFGELLEGFCIIEVLFDADNRPVDYRFLEINPAFEAQTGLHDAQGKRMLELAPEHEAHWFEIYGKVALTGESVRFVNEASALNRWYDVSAYRIGGPDSRKVAILFNDITEAKRAERGLKRTAEELARSNRDLEQFAYVASHDLQEPLRMVTGYLQLLNRRYKEKLDKDAREFIDFAVDGSTRMSRLITELLDFSRINTRGKSPEPVAMEAVLQRAVGNLQTAIRDSAAQITHDPLPTVRGDATQLVQVLQNLVGNAIKFRSANRPIQVCIGAQKKDDAWVFSVRDNGIGIEPQYAEKIFLIFQRLHSRGEYPGTGIGLAICKRIVERHGGRIWVESQLGQGSTFFFTIGTSRASR